MERNNPSLGVHRKDSAILHWKVVERHPILFELGVFCSALDFSLDGLMDLK